MEFSNIDLLRGPRIEVHNSTEMQRFRDPHSQSRHGSKMNENVTNNYFIVV